MNQTTYPVEPWEIRAYVEEDPSREYRPGRPGSCVLARYCNERLGGVWYQGGVWLGEYSAELGQICTYEIPSWARQLIFAFDCMAFEHGEVVTGKQILEADILPKENA